MTSRYQVFAATFLLYAAQGFAPLRCGSSTPRLSTNSKMAGPRRLSFASKQQASLVERRATIVSNAMVNETWVGDASSGKESVSYTSSSFMNQQHMANKKRPRRKGGKNRGLSQREKLNDVYNLNEALNRLAEQAGDSRQPVIQRAMAAEELWRDTTGEHDDDDDNIDTSSDSEHNKAHPDTVSFNTVLKGWSRATHVLAEHHEDPRNHDHLLDPDIPIYTARECAVHALELLNQQEKEFENKSKEDDTAESSNKFHGTAAPDLQSYNTVMDTWSKSFTSESISQVEDLLRRLQKSKTLQPDVISYGALVDAYAFSDHDDRLDKLRKIWKYMEETPNLQPSARTTNSILHAYSRWIREHPLGEDYDYDDELDASGLADEALEKFEDLKRRFAAEGRPQDEPDVLSYSTAMDVFAKVGTAEATRKVEALFRELKERTSSNDGVDLNPNLYSYTTLITAWSRVAFVEEASERVSSVLEEMVADENLPYLNHRPFTSALRCWSRGTVAGKGLKALNTLKRMKELSKTEPYVAPNIQTYHAALECCAKPSDSDPRQHTAALKISFAILQSMTKDGIVPNQTTYSKLLRCVEALLPPGPERNQVGQAAFEKALAAGMVEKHVIQSFKKACDVQIVLKTLGEISDHNGYVDYSRIPHSWKKNVKS